MPTAHMMIGNIGCGKSEFAAHLLKKLNKAVVVNMDAITEMFHGRYGAYNPDMKQVYQDTEDAAIRTALRSDIDVIIDRTNLTLKSRARFIDICKEYNAEIHAYHFPANPSHPFYSMLQNRMKNPRGVSEYTWQSVMQKMYESYECPKLYEGISVIHDYHTTQLRHKFLAVDFDGTIVGHDFPKIGAPVKEVIEHMKKFWHQSLLHRIIIWTCRSGEYELLMREWLIKNKVPFDFINENPLFETGSRKIYADDYLDDRNMNLMRVG